MKCPAEGCDFESENWAGMNSHLRSHLREKGVNEDEETIMDKWKAVKRFIANGGVSVVETDHLEFIEDSIKERLSQEGDNE